MTALPASKTIFWIYLLSLTIIAALPINGFNSTLHNNYIVQIRLDYILHALLIIPMPFLLSRAFSNKSILNILIGLCLAITLEAIQYFLPYRTFNINDLIANSIGLFLGILLLLPFISNLLSGIFPSQSS